MLGIGPWELAIIIIIALVLIGPRKLPDIMKQVGKGMFELRKASNDFRRSLEFEVTQEERDEQQTRVMAERAKYMQQLQEEQNAAGDGEAGAGAQAADRAPAEGTGAVDEGAAAEAPKPAKTS